MAINNLVTLRAAVIDWVARTDLSDAQVDLFIDAAEDEIVHGVFDPSGRVVIPPLRCHSMEVRNDGFALSGEYTDLPTGFAGFRVVKLIGNPNIELDYVTPDFFNATYLSTVSTTTAKAYTIEGGQLRVGPGASVTDTLSIIYYKDPDNVVSSNTNWILTKYPLVYLYGALRHLGIYVGMDTRLGFFQSAFLSALAALHSKEKAIEFSGTSLVVQTRGVTKT